MALPAVEARSIPGTHATSGTTRGLGRGSLAGQLRQEMTYGPDRSEEQPYFRDLLLAREGRDSEAMDRLHRNNREAADYWGPEHERRDMSAATSTAGLDFVPPLYLADLWVSALDGFAAVRGRAAQVPAGGKWYERQHPVLDLRASSVAARADLGTVWETDGVTARIAHDVNEIAGRVESAGWR